MIRYISTQSLFVLGAIILVNLNACSSKLDIENEKQKEKIIKNLVKDNPLILPPNYLQRPVKATENPAKDLE